MLKLAVQEAEPGVSVLGTACKALSSLRVSSDSAASKRAQVVLIAAMPASVARIPTAVPRALQQPITVLFSSWSRWCEDLTNWG